MDQQPSPQVNPPAGGPVNEQPGAQPPSPPAGGAQPPKKGYGKKPLWFWLLVYLVVGGIIYAIIYFVFLSGNGGGSPY